MVRTRTKVGAGIAATAAGVAAGYYFFASKNAKRNRKIAAKWANDLKSDIETQVKKLKDIDRSEVMAIVDKAARAYGRMPEIRQKDLERAAKELKSNWQRIAKNFSKATPRSRAKKKRR